MYDTDISLYKCFYLFPLPHVVNSNRLIFDPSEVEIRHFTVKQTFHVLLRFVDCLLKYKMTTGKFLLQTDQRSDDSNLQHVEGETGKNRYKAVS